MKVTNNTRAPQSKVDWRIVSLVVLQIAVVLLTNCRPTPENASRALP